MLQNISRLTVIGAFIAGIFAVDMTTPLGLGVPFLYLLVVLFAIGNRVGNQELLAITAISTALAAVKLLILPPDGIAWFGQTNRLIFSLLIWTAVGVELFRRRYEKSIEAARQRFHQELEAVVAARTAALHRANRELEKEIAERKQAEETVNDYASRLHGLAEQLVEAQETERKHLAAELHDRIGQNLSALNLSLNLILTQLPKDAAALMQPRIADALELVERTTEMVRGVMEELRPALLDQYGLDVAVRWYGVEFSRRTGIRVEHMATELFPRLRSEVETTLFRIVQEALTNVAKHAGAREVVIALKRSAGGIELRVADDGIGIPADTAPSQTVGSGWGLALIGERARSIGAALRLESGSQGGTTVVVEAPNGTWELMNGNYGTDR